MYLLGGYTEIRQISQVSGCRVERIDNLNFDFEAGACTVIHSQVLLCFDNNDGRVCRMANSPTGSFSKTRESIFFHHGIRIASNGGKLITQLSGLTKSLTSYLDSVMAVGSRKYRASHNYAEMYFHSTLSWKKRASYDSHGQKSIFRFDIIAHSDYFILFGGAYTDESKLAGFDETNIIAKFNPGLNKWSKIGKLREKRNAFGVIKVDNDFLVIAGGKQTEICEFDGDTIECISRKSTLGSLYYPAIMLVSSDYADNC